MKKTNEIVLDEFYYHEALDRCFCVQEIIDNILLQHPAILQTPEWKENVEKVQESLADLYQSIGQKKYEVLK